MTLTIPMMSTPKKKKGKILTCYRVFLEHAFIYKDKLFDYDIW